MNVLKKGVFFHSGQDELKFPELGKNEVKPDFLRNYLLTMFIVHLKFF